MPKPSTRPESRSRALRLARELRALGLHLLDDKAVEARFGRPLTRNERRALCMARDSAAHPADDTARANAKRNIAIAAGANVKYAGNRGFRSNQSSPKAYRTGGMRPLPKGEYLPQGDFTGRAPESNPHKAFDGSRDQYRVHVADLSRMRAHDVLQPEIIGWRGKRSRLHLNQVSVITGLKGEGNAITTLPAVTGKANHKTATQSPTDDGAT